MDRLTVSGYKSLKDINVELKKINILIGSNGAGKSNFLSVFEFLSAIYEQRLTQYIGTIGSVDRVLFQGRKVTNRIKLNIKNKQNSYYISLVEADGALVIESEDLEYCVLPDKCNSISISSYKRESGLKNYSGAKRGEYIKKYISEIHKYHFHDTGCKSPFASDSNVINDSYGLYSHGSNIASVLYKTQKENPIIYKQIIKVIQSVAPYFLDFYFKPSEAGTIRLQWKDKYSEYIYGPSDFSDGTIRFVALTTLFLQPNLPSVIIIDEPELGLHPLAIKKLSGLIRIASQRGAQIMIATQSADFISEFTPDEVLTVDQNNGETVINRLDESRLNPWLEDYTLGDLWIQNIFKGGQPL